MDHLFVEYILHYYLLVVSMGRYILLHISSIVIPSTWSNSIITVYLEFP